MQITMSPYYGNPDFSPLADRSQGPRRMDPVSVADLLRNGFVYPPHSILEDVKLVTYGFSPLQDMHTAPEFRFKFRAAAGVPDTAASPQDWVAAYHEKLCAATRRACQDMASPWLLQSGGKDSTTLAIALAETRPDATCITYLGGREENEVASGRHVARTLGLRHEVLLCDPGRAYDRYVGLVDRMPLLTADFALLSYIDLATEVANAGGDGVIDGMGSDSYFGAPMDRQKWMLSQLARQLRLPPDIAGLPLVSRSFWLCFLLGTLQMSPVERTFPGSRFSDAEVDELLGGDLVQRSRKRMDVFIDQLSAATSAWEWRDMSMSIAGSAGAFAKGLFTANALSLGAAYPFCDQDLREWVHNVVPHSEKIDPRNGMNKVLIRQHIARRFGPLPYVRKKGSFRFDVSGLGRQRFDQVRDFAVLATEYMPGAVAWLDRNRGRLDNKYHASKFYLLAIVLPWMAHHGASRQPRERGVQIAMSPYYGKPDFSSLPVAQAGRGPIDPVSVADLLRNAFVQPPHSIFEGVKLATHGFDPGRDQDASPEFRFRFPDSGKRRDHDAGEQDWVGTYHRLLCGAMAAGSATMSSPWLLQSGGKDSTSLAIAASDARPDTTCITYLGGREENEVASALAVARTLGLRHETLVCDPGRAYDRYLALVDRMPLLTADFALLSYVDLATEVASGGGDGVIDGLGSDSYFGAPASGQHRLLSGLAMGLRLPRRLTELPLVNRSFRLCFAISTLQMEPLERMFPGTRFTNAEVDALFGFDIARLSRKRMESYRAEIESATSLDEARAMSISIAEAGGAYAKGLYTTSALGLRAAYPYCNAELREWVYREVPADQRVDPVTRTGKVLVRRHIATRFDELPYLSRKGSFRFDLCGLAAMRYDAVHALARDARDLLPGALPWLERNRRHLDNKYHASKFYLLAIVLPWVLHHGMQPRREAGAAIGTR